MVSLAQLWLPILLSAVIVFVASSVIHMVTRWHESDYTRVPDEERFRAAVGPLALAPGDYLVPRPATRAEIRDPAFLEKVNRGPNVVMTVMPNGPFTMGAQLGAWFIYSIVLALFAAYLASRTLTRGTEYLEVFRVTGTVAFIGYAGGLWQMSIWYKRRWSTTVRSTVDALIYGLLVGGVFGWLWPR